MLSAIWNGLLSVISGINALVNFVVMLVEGTAKLIAMIVPVVSQIQQAVTYLPFVFQVFALASITVMVVFVIVGRTHSKG